MEEKFLPIGTVVELKGAKKNTMITNYFIYSKDGQENKIYEYGGCPLPIGVQKDVSLGFNHEDIEKVIYMGYIDDESKRFNEYLKANADKIVKEIQEKLSNK